MPTWKAPAFEATPAVGGPRSAIATVLGLADDRVQPLGVLD